MRRRRLLTVLLFVLLVGIPGCGGARAVFRLLMVPKLTGIPYFQACKQGAEEAARELKIDLVYDGPTTADADAQVSLLKQAVASGEYQGLLVACNDPDRVSPALRKARDSGLLVVTFDADAREGRQFFVNQATYDSVAREMVDVMAEQLRPRGEGEVALLTSYRTAPNQSEWARRMRAYAAEKYPKMHLLEETEHGEDRGQGVTKAQALIAAHPDLKGIIGLTSVAVPAAAEAVRQAVQQGQLKKGQLKVTGVSTPKDMRDYVEDGTVETFVLWNPVDLGYLTVYVADLLRQDKMPAGGTGTIRAGRLGEIQVRDHEVLLGPPMRFTKSNIGQFDF
jgi:ABC-type sugar transport system substrate-binding protein